MTDIVLAVVRDRRWADLDCYALSLARSGFVGRKVMLVEDVPQDACDNLRGLGFEVVPFRSPASGLHFQTTRFASACSFLEHESARYVFWSDACDVVFQRDPSIAVDECLHGAQLLAVKEGWAIKNQPINDVWIQQIGLSRDEYLRLREEEVLCSGSIAGARDAVLLLFNRMCVMFHQAGAMQGIDQGIFNHLVRTDPFRNMVRIPEPSEAFVTTCGIFLAPSNPNDWTIEPPVFDLARAEVRTPDGLAPYAVVHQYNRHHGLHDPDGLWRGTIERRFR